VERASPPPHLVSDGQRLIHRLDLAAAYARVDAADVNGALMLMELELIEPELFLEHHPESAARLADAVLAAVRHRVRSS
jgi:hypothetical protein